MYANRASLLPNNPAIVFLQTGNNRGRLNLAKVATDLGQTSLAMDDNAFNRKRSAFPDSSVLDEEQLRELKPYVRNFRCGTAVEKGEPFCSAEKWTHTNITSCDSRKFRTGWHPGWKWHAWSGHVNTLFLVDIIQDALDWLETPDAIGDLTVFADKLRQADKADQQAFAASTYSHTFRSSPPDVSVDVFLRSPNYCHTARMPAETRTKGYLTGIPNDPGIGLRTALTTSEAPRKMPLVYDESARQPCKIQLQNDFKDFFLVSGKHNEYASVTIPTDAEVAAYGIDPHQLKGVIAVCSASCGWRCPKGTLDPQTGVFHGTAHFTVNGVTVANVTKWEDCLLLRRDDDSHYWKANAQGRFEIAAKVDSNAQYMRLSSFVVW